MCKCAVQGCTNVAGAWMRRSDPRKAGSLRAALTEREQIKKVHWTFVNWVASKKSYHCHPWRDGVLLLYPRPNHLPHRDV